MSISPFHNDVLLGGGAKELVTHVAAPRGGGGGDSSGSATCLSQAKFGKMSPTKVFLSSAGSILTMILNLYK